MIFGIGTDIISYRRVGELYAKYGARFAKRILSEREYAEYAEHGDPTRLLMKRFAAKEALSKAVGSGLRHPVTLQNISIVHDALGKPGFRFAPELEDYLRVRGIGRHHLSISDEREHAVAFVILEGEH